MRNYAILFEMGENTKKDTNSGPMLKPDEEPGPELVSFYLIIGK